jgi:hypothetical protein
MKKNDGQLNGEQRELLIDLYIEGLDARDDEKIAKVLQFTLRDEELDERISRVNSFYSQEIGLNELAQTVVELAHEHLPSAFKENDYEEKNLTFGDVAKQLIAKNRVPNGEEETTRQLTENATPLPNYLTLAEIKRIAGELSLKIKDQYWTPFFREAGFLRMRESQQQAAFATRTKRLQKKKENQDGSGEKTKNK